MDTSKREILLTGLGFAEAPRWRDGRLWFSDMAMRRVVAVDLEGRVEVICGVDETPSGLGWLPDGRLLVVSAHDRKLLRLDVLRGRRHLVVHAALGHLVQADLNDMVVDVRGNAYISNFGYDPAAEAPAATGIVLVRPDGSSEMLAGNLMRPNGMAISPDGQTFVVAETRVHRLSAFSIDAEGRLLDHRIVGDLGSGSWADGICMDEQGAVWVGDPRRSRCVRVMPGVGITDIIDTEIPCVACMLGGGDRRTLFLCEAPVRPMHVGASDPQGRIELVRVDVPGAGRP